MIAVMDHFRPRPLDGPSPSWLRLSLHSRLVTIPELYVGVFGKASQSTYELLAQFLILPVRPGLGYFQDIALLMQETTHGLVRALHLILLCNMAMECGCGPEGPHGTAWYFELFEDIFFPFTRDKRSPARSPLCHETIDAIRVEG